MPFFVQNYGLKDDRCQHWKASKITKIYFHHWIHRPRFVQSTIFHQNWSICRSFNYGLKDDRCQYWKVSRITESYCHQWIQLLQIVHYAKFRGKWLTSFLVLLFKDSREIGWVVLNFIYNCVCFSVEHRRRRQMVEVKWNVCVWNNFYLLCLTATNFMKIFMKSFQE